ncbi:MAG: 6,7-dimethyl-8-ribityllumazine synthase [Planctomycetaceae bacterium]|jgi:6,7-dimethyl-8-ribityllumazine synthase
MVTEIEARMDASGARFAIVVSRFNDLITDRLLQGALQTITRHGGDAQQAVVVRVPGSFEIPLAAQQLARSGKFDAVVCLGAVIQGSTTHHEYINSQVAAGIMAASRESGIPITFGVITCESMEQALDRAGGKVGNKGQEASVAAIEMIGLLKQLETASL